HRFVREMRAHDQSVLGVAVSGDGRRIVSGSKDRAVHFWDGETGKLLFSGSHGRAVNSVAVTPSGRLALSGSDDRTVRVWDVPRQRALRTWIAHDGPVGAVRFSDDGTLALSGGDDRRIRVWSLAPSQDM